MRRCFLTNWIFRSVLFGFFIATIISPALADSSSIVPVARGVLYRYYQYDNLHGGPQRVHVLDVDANNPAVSVRFAYALGDAHGDPYQTVPQFAARIPNAVGAINAQFFDLANKTGSIQYLKVNGSVVDPGGWTDAEQRAITTYDNGKPWISIRPSAGWGGYASIPNIMASGPDMITFGTVRTTYPDDSLFTARHPRTAAAWTYDNRLLLVVVDGRRTGIATGMNLAELAQTIADLGNVRHAFNFDGGGSSTLWAGGSVRNLPSGGTLRAVANAVVVASEALPNSDIVVDNQAAHISGTWSTGTSSSDKLGPDYRFAEQGTGSRYVDFIPRIPETGRYEVYEWHPQGTNRSTGTPHWIYHSTGVRSLKVNQQVNGGRWNYLGTYHFMAGTSSRVRVTDGFSDSGKVALADAVKFVRAPAENALRIHGGLASSATENTLLLDVAPGGVPTGKVTLEDAVRHARKAAGLDP